MWVGKSTHLTHQPVVGWAGLQNFWFTRKWAGLGSLIFNPTHFDMSRLNHKNKIKNMLGLDFGLK